MYSAAGKRVETIRKLLESRFNEAAWRQPSVIVLDDLDHVSAAPSGAEQEMSGEALYYTRVAEGESDEVFLVSCQVLELCVKILVGISPFAFTS